jgi:hypothetical protein
MFVSDKLIYIQLQKTGCTHIANLLSKCIGGKYILSEHVGKHNWLQNYNINKLIIGSIRNPWDWYVSLWAYGCNKKGFLNLNVTRKDIKNLRSPIFIKLKTMNEYKGPYYNIGDICKNTINEIFLKPTSKWNELYSSYSEKKNFRTWLNFLLKSRKQDVGEGYYQSSISDFAGLLTYRYCKLFHKNFFKKDIFKGIKNFDCLNEFDKKNNILDYTIKTENIENDLIYVLNEVGYKIDKKIKNIISVSGKTNISKHFNTEFYYDDETAKLVYEKEKLIIDKYKYLPPIPLT